MGVLSQLPPDHVETAAVKFSGTVPLVYTVIFWDPGLLLPFAAVEKYSEPALVNNPGTLAPSVTLRMLLCPKSAM